MYVVENLHRESVWDQPMPIAAAAELTACAAGSHIGTHDYVSLLAFVLKLVTVTPQSYQRILFPYHETCFLTPSSPDRDIQVAAGHCVHVSLSRRQLRLLCLTPPTWQHDGFQVAGTKHGHRGG